MLDDFAQQPFAIAEFADNPEARCACVLLLDVSGSMKGEPIDQLNSGLEQFASELREDRLAAKRVDIAVVTFGGKVKVAAEFGSAQLFYPPPLTADGDTPLGDAVDVALDLLAARQIDYRENGITPYRPWVFLITDGAPTDKWARAAARVREGEAKKSFSFFSIGVHGADMKMLAALSVKAPVLLRGLAFADMFRWLSSSLSAVSRSSVGGSVTLENPAGPNGWAVIP